MRGRRLGQNDSWLGARQKFGLRKTEEFKKIRGERQWKMEGSFAEAKENHCLGRARYRGRTKMQIQAYMIGLVLNLKRLVTAQPELAPLIHLLFRFFEKLAQAKIKKYLEIFRGSPTAIPA